MKQTRPFPLYDHRSYWDEVADYRRRPVVHPPMTFAEQAGMVAGIVAYMAAIVVAGFVVWSIVVSLLVMA